MNQAPLTDQEVISEGHDVEIMRRRHLWAYGSFLPLKHRVAVDLYGVHRTAILYHFEGNPGQRNRYVFLPEVNMYSIPAKFWTDPTHFRSGGVTLLYEIIMEGWIVC